MNNSNSRTLPIKITLPADFLEEEIRDGYTISVASKMMWAIELDLLNEFIKVCDKYNLKWYMSSGSMLGAVRHNGFIPWDDDIDVYMPRKDADFLTQISEQEFKGPYFLQTPDVEKDKSFFRVHPQLRNSYTTGSILADKDKNINRGVFLDIFILDDAPDDITLIRSTKQKLDVIWSEVNYICAPLNLNGTNYKIFKRILKKCYFSFKYMFYKIRYGSYYEYYQSVSRRFKNDYCQNYICWFFYKPGREFSMKDWEKTLQMNFEFLTVNVPAGFHDILTKTYGDYMKPDPNYQTSHGGVIFDPMVPYTQYFAK